MDTVIATSVQRCNRYVKFATPSRRRCQGVPPTLRQLWKDCKMWTLDWYMVTFPQPCLKVGKKFFKDVHFSGMHVQNYDIKFSPLFPLHILEISKNCFRKVQRYQKQYFAVLQFEILQKNFPTLGFPSILKRTTFKEKCVINHCHKKVTQRFPNKMI